MRDLERIESFLRGISERAAADLVPFNGGVAFLHDDFPIVWDLNFLSVRSPEEVTVGDVVAACEAILGAAGLKHRKAEVMYSSVGVTLAKSFAKLPGWRVNRLITMKLTRAPDRALVPGVAEEVGVEALQGFREEGTRRGPYGGNEDHVRQLVDKNMVWYETTTARHFAARVDDRIVSGCDLYVVDGVAQIEDVETFEEARNKGLGRAVVGTAAAAAAAAGCDLIFLNADDDDWPKALYRKLGFDTIGTFHQFLRTPEGSAER